jgi:hypothetical protein
MLSTEGWQFKKNFRSCKIGEWDKLSLSFLSPMPNSSMRSRNLRGPDLKVMGLKSKESLAAKAKKFGLNPEDVFEAFGHPSPLAEEFKAAREAGDLQELWRIFGLSQKGSVFAKKVLREIISRLEGPSDVPELWNAYHLTSGECDLAEEILHKINLSTSLLQNWMDVIRYSKSGDEVHEEAIRYAKLHADSRDVLWTLFQSTENYALRKSILGKILVLSSSGSDLMQVLRAAEHGYPELRNRCLRRLLTLKKPDITVARESSGPTRVHSGETLVTRPLSRTTTRRAFG